MGQNSQSSPQQWSEQSTDAYIWGCHRQLDDQYRNPNINNRDHLVGQLTTQNCTLKSTFWISEVQNLTPLWPPTLYLVSLKPMVISLILGFNFNCPCSSASSVRWMTSLSSFEWKRKQHLQCKNINLERFFCKLHRVHYKHKTLSFISKKNRWLKKDFDQVFVRDLDKIQKEKNLLLENGHWNRRRKNPNFPFFFLQILAQM